VWGFVLQLLNYDYCDKRSSSVVVVVRGKRSNGSTGIGRIGNSELARDVRVCVDGMAVNG
jgi:hypothetical protein